MKHFLIFLFLIGGTLTDTFAQDSGKKDGKKIKKELSIEAGLSQGFFKDSHFSPLNYRSIGPLLDLGFVRENEEKGLFKVSLDFTPSIIKTDNSEFFQSSLLHGNLAFTYLRKLKPNNRHLSILAGANYKSIVNFVLFDGVDSFTFLMAHSFGLEGLARYKFTEDQSLETGLSIPVFFLMVRPPYSGYDKELLENLNHPLRFITDGNWSAIHKYFSFDWYLKYRQDISSKWDLTVKYALNYQRLKTEEKFIYLQNQVNVGFAYKF